MNVRIAVYIIGAAVAALLVATISSARLAGFASVPSVALFAVVLGLAQSAVAPALARVPALAGCWPFAIVSGGVAAVVFWLGGRVVPGMDVSIAGVLVGGVIAAVSAVAIYTLMDERAANA
jgi:hypothetical protein